MKLNHNKISCIKLVHLLYLYRTLILPVVLYECETWSLTLREEHRLRMCENRVLRRIFAIKAVYTNKVHMF